MPKYRLTLKPTRLPSEETIPDIVDAARELIDETYHWDFKKNFNGDVDVYKRPVGDSAWFCRKSLHRDISYEQFRSGLLLNHSSQEREYIPNLQAANRIEQMPHLEGKRTAVDQVKM